MMMVMLIVTHVFTVNLLALMSCSLSFSRMSSLRLFCWMLRALPPLRRLPRMPELPAEGAMHTYIQSLSPTFFSKLLQIFHSANYHHFTAKWDVHNNFITRNCSPLIYVWLI